MSDVYEAWKPLRNYLRKANLIEALAAVRYYSVRRMLREPPPPPSDLELHKWADKDNAFLAWELETLAREVVISSEIQPNPSVDLKKAHDMAFAMNKMKDIENFVEDQYINQKNIRHEVTVRLSHRQFKYQTDRPSIETMVRYSKIFGHPEVAPIVKRKTGLEPKQLFTIGSGLWQNYTTRFGMHYPLETLSITGISEADYDRFMALYSKPLGEIKQLLVDPSERHMDDRFIYGHHSLYTYPIIFTELNGKPTHVCPLPTLLYWRVTSGVYYDLYSERGFDNAFGNSFEEYVGEMLRKTYKDTTIKVFAGELNTTKSPNRTDWLIDKPTDCLLVECKTKRLTMGAKTSLSDDELFKQLNILGDAIAQSYLSLKAYQDGSYAKPSYKMDKSKKAYVCVTTLEKWYLMGPQLEMLHEIVKEKVVDAGLADGIIDDSPYVVMPVDDFEKLAYLAKSYSITDILEPYVNGKRNEGWEFASYMFNAFGDEIDQYEYVFDDEIKNVYTVELDTSQRRNRKRKDDTK